MPIHSHIPQCQHIKVNGIRCGSPALRGRDLCYFHDRTRREFGAEVPGLLLPLSLESPEAIQISLMKILREIVDGTLTPRIASLLLRGIQIAVSNSRRLHFDTPYANHHAVRSMPKPKHAAYSPSDAHVGQTPQAPPPARTSEARLRAAGAAHSVPAETGNLKHETTPRETRNEKRETCPAGVPLRPAVGLSGEGESSDLFCSEPSRDTDDTLIRQLHDLTRAYLSPDSMERNNGNRRT